MSASNSFSGTTSLISQTYFRWVPFLFQGTNGLVRGMGTFQTEQTVSFLRRWGGGFVLYLLLPSGAEVQRPSIVSLAESADRLQTFRPATQPLLQFQDLPLFLPVNISLALSFLALVELHSPGWPPFLLWGPSECHHAWLLSSPSEMSY